MVHIKDRWVNEIIKISLMQTYAKSKLSHSFVSIKKCAHENFVGVILLWSNILQYTILQYTSITLIFSDNPWI